MKEIRIIIAGGRDFNDYKKLEDSVIAVMVEKDTHFRVVRIVSGMARGADQLGVRFARKLFLKLSSFPANWDNYGKMAGYIRNIEMAKFATENNNQGILIAFWDGKSKGTKHMIDTAKEYGMEVHVINY